MRTGSGEDTSFDICPEDSRVKSRSPRVEACNEYGGNNASTLKMTRQAQGTEGIDTGQPNFVPVDMDIRPRCRAVLRWR
jgi:hypothetical protein